MTRWQILLVLLGVCAYAQDKPPEKGTISGTVVNANTGVPLNKVELFLEGNGSLFTLTDAKGNFEFTGVNPGQYRVKGQRNGFLETYYGARRAEGSGIP